MRHWRSRVLVIGLVLAKWGLLPSPAAEGTSEAERFKVLSAKSVVRAVPALDECSLGGRSCTAGAALKACRVRTPVDSSFLRHKQISTS